MPPSPTIHIELNQARYAEVCAELRITQPTCRFLQHSRGGQFYGDYNYSQKRIRIFSNCAQYDRDRLPFVSSELVKTLLHELRHAWQHAHWTPEEKKRNNEGVYPHTRAEEDAERYARENCHRFHGLVAVKRKFHGSGLSRLAKTERNVRS